MSHPTTTSALEHPSSSPNDETLSTNSNNSRASSLPAQPQIPSLSSLTSHENTRQSSRFSLLSQKLAELHSIQSQLNGRRHFSDRDLERLNRDFQDLAEDISRIWQDYRQFQQQGGLQMPGESAGHSGVNATGGGGVDDADHGVEHAGKRRGTMAAARRRQQKQHEQQQYMDNDDDDDDDLDRTNAAHDLPNAAMHTNSTQQKVTERLQKLFHSDEEFEALEREIRDYERRHGIANQKLVASYKEKMRENRELLKNFNEKRHEILDEGFRKREERSLKARAARKKVDNNLVRYTRDLERSIDDKLERASQRKLQLQYDTKLSELKMKWSYIVAFWVRVLILAGRLEDDRHRRAAKEKQERLTKVVYDRMMPIVWQRRSERWQACWTSFQHHWTWYQLWITTKKKKHATAMIKSFLKDTHSSLKLVTQVHHFKEKIKKCQGYVRKYHTVRESRMLALLLQYTIVESKLINNEPLLSMEKKMKVQGVESVGTPRTDDSRPTSASNPDKKGKLSSRSRASPGNTARGPPGRPNSKRKGRAKNKAQVKKAFLHMEPKDMIANSLSLVRPSYKMRMALLKEVYKQRRAVYEKELSEYTTVLKMYEQKYRQFIHYQRAQAILKDESIDLPEDDEIELSENLFDPFNDKLEKKREELIDENGEMIPRPSEPFFSVYISEKDMEDIVMRGFQRVRDLEEEKYEELEQDENTTEDVFIKYENKHLKNVMRVFREIRSFFGDHVYEQYSELFKKANIAANVCVKERREMKAILKRKQNKKGAKRPTTSGTTG